MSYSFHFVLISTTLLALSFPARAATIPAWHTDYHTGVDAATANRQLALIWFFDPAQSEANGRFERDTLSNPKIASLLTERYAPIKLPTTASVSSGGEQIKIGRAHV